MKILMPDVVSGVCRSLGILLLGIIGGASWNSLLHAQSVPELKILVMESDRPDAIISFTAGPAFTYARGEFPSLLIGNTLGGSGTVPAEYAVAGAGHSLDLEGLIYFPMKSSNCALGMTLGLTSTRYVAQFDGDDTLEATRLELQQADARIGVHYDAIVLPSRSGFGFRSVYLEGAVEVGLGILANRVEAGMIADSTTEVRVPATGSFETNEPFRHRIGLNLAAGTMIDLTGYKNGLSAVFEVGYSLGLNPVFSSDVLRNSSLSTDYLTVKGGLGYRF